MCTLFIASVLPQNTSWSDLDSKVYLKSVAESLKEIQQSAHKENKTEKIKYIKIQKNSLINVPYAVCPIVLLFNQYKQKH